MDLLLIETSQDILEVRAAIFGCRAAIAEAGEQVALQIQVTLDTSGRMLLGTDIDAALTTLGRVYASTGTAASTNYVGITRHRSLQDDRDLRQALRSLRSTPVTSIVAALAIALGVGVKAPRGI